MLHVHRKLQFIWFSNSKPLLVCVFCMAPLWPQACCLGLFQSLRSPLKLLLPKGSRCVKTHLLPADGSFPGHTLPPAGPSGYWHRLPLLRSLYGLSVSSTSSNAGEYLAFSWPLQSTLSIQWYTCCDNAEILMLVIPSFLLQGIKHEWPALKNRVGEMSKNCL